MAIDPGIARDRGVAIDLSVVRDPSVAIDPGIRTNVCSWSYRSRIGYPTTTVWVLVSRNRTVAKIKRLHSNHSFNIPIVLWIP